MGCNQEDYQPKPRGYFRMSLPEASNTALQGDCPYTFKYNSSAIWKPKENCWGTLYYPSLKADVQFTYKNISNAENLEKILAESQQLAYEHAVKADGIAERSYVDEEKKVYGIFYSMQGNSASSTQFYITDSTTHYLRGVLYFYSIPNADSLQPVNAFMQKEITQIIESLNWK